MSKQENIALKGLQKNNKLAIKPADKGGGIVVMDKEEYEKEIMRQLNDMDTYKKLKSDPTSSPGKFLRR